MLIVRLPGISLLLLVALAAVTNTVWSQAEPATESAPEAEGQLNLFDGKSLDGWTVTEFGGQREVAVVDGTIQLNAGGPLTGITYDGDPPTDNYELTFEARRMHGSDFFAAATFPVADSHCTLVLGGWGGTVVGLSCLDDKDASENETTQYIKFEREQWYAVRIRVAEKRIQCWLDEKPIIDVTLDGRKISLRSEVLLSRPLGICSFATEAQLRNIKLKTVSAEETPSVPTAPSSDRYEPVEKPNSS